jgi:hypothetical protein
MDGGNGLEYAIKVLEAAENWLEQLSDWIYNKKKGLIPLLE